MTLGIMAASTRWCRPSGLLCLLVLVATVRASVSQRYACGIEDGDPLCRCTYNENRQRKVDCSGLDLLTVPPGIPDNTHILDLSENSIETITSDALSHLTNLRRLFLIQNIIRGDLLDENVFGNLRNLRLLDLSGNRIGDRQDYAKLFLPLLVLRELDLHDNGINTVDPEFVTVLDRLDILTMTSNPLICDCNLLWFRNWLINKSPQNFQASGVQCATPSSVANQAVLEAIFCIPVQRCYFCDMASSNAGCNFAQQQCSGTNPACQNEVRWNGGSFYISKQCKALDACLNNAMNNENECNSKMQNSVCRYCCQGDKCNSPESAILDDYQFPFPDTVRPTAEPTTFRTPTARPIPPTTAPQITTPPLPTTQAPISPSTSLPQSTAATTTTVGATLTEAHACEGSELDVNCPDGGTIAVERALYGRVLGADFCSLSPSAASCGDSEVATPAVRQRCQGREECSFRATNGVFGDPCPNVYKYLVVWYACVGGEPTTFPTTARTTQTVATQGPTASSPVPVTPAICPAGTTEGETGLFLWPATLAGDAAIVPCPHDESAGKVLRRCVRGQDGLGTSWEVPDTSVCPTAASILEDLSNMTINGDNALDVSETLTDVTAVPDVLRPDDVTNAVNTFENLAGALGEYDEASPEVLGNVLDVIDKLGQVSDNSLFDSQLNDGSSSRLLRTIDSFNLGVQLQSNVLEKDTPSIDVALVDLVPPKDDGGILFFGAGKPGGNSHPNLVYNSTDDAQELLSLNESAVDEIVLGSMRLPNSLFESIFTPRVRCQFVMFEDTTFFDVIQSATRNRTQSNRQEEEERTVLIPTADRDGSEVTTNSTPTGAPPADCVAFSCRPGYQTIINSVVISGAVGGQTITNLQEPVTITFRKSRMDADNPRCVFWDESKNDAWGGWSNDGCRLAFSNNPETTDLVCQCDHLTNFALLMDIYDNDVVIPEGHQVALSIISYTGCTLSLIGLVLTLVTYTCCGRQSRAKLNEKKFTADQRSKVMVNFVVSLILVNVFFLAGSITAEFEGDAFVPELCTAFAVCLHFSLVAAMAWMAIQAFNMYMALVKVFATYYSHFLLKLVVIGWGIPVIIVGITVGIDLENYGNNSGVCWLTGIPFYVAFLVPVCLVLLFNFVVFAAVTWKLCNLRKSKISKTDRFDLGAQMRATVSITILLGLTWILGIFAIGEASLTFMYLFAAFNSLQGFSVFVFQCLLQPEMRKRWVAACCPYCGPQPTDSKSGVYSSSRSQSNMTNPTPNWRKGTTNTTLSASYAENPTYAITEN